MLICTRVVQFIAKAISINCLLDNKHLVGNYEVWISVFLISLGCRSFVYSLLIFLTTLMYYYIVSATYFASSWLNYLV